MPDRVSVMSWLEGLTQDDWRQYNSDSEVQKIARSALALLEKQEPVEPIEEVNVQNGWFRCWGGCGNCAELLYGQWNYCPNCGRRVKW